jgi:hypothetical protein
MAVRAPNPAPITVIRDILLTFSFIADIYLRARRGWRQEPGYLTFITGLKIRPAFTGFNFTTGN